MLSYPVQEVGVGRGQVQLEGGSLPGTWVGGEPGPQLARQMPPAGRGMALFRLRDSENRS